MCKVQMAKLSPVVMMCALQLVMVVMCSSFSSCAEAIDPNRDCSNKFPKLNYKPVTSVCKPKVPATKACCAAFNKLACQYRSRVNNFNSICPILFMAYLNYAGGYQDGYFIGKCIDGKKGLCA